MWNKIHGCFLRFAVDNLWKWISWKARTFLASSVTFEQQLVGSIQLALWLRSCSEKSWPDWCRHSPLSTSMELRWSRWTVSGSWGSASQRHRGLSIQGPHVRRAHKNTGVSSRAKFLSTIESNRKHPDWKHYKLAWFVHGPGAKGSAGGN